MHMHMHMISCLEIVGFGLDGNEECYGLGYNDS